MISGSDPTASCVTLMISRSARSWSARAERVPQTFTEFGSQTIAFPDVSHMAHRDAHCLATSNSERVEISGERLGIRSASTDFDTPAGLPDGYGQVILESDVCEFDSSHPRQPVSSLSAVLVGNANSNILMVAAAQDWDYPDLLT